MPRPTPMPLRRAVFARMQAHQAAGQIAAELDLPIRTVEKLLARFRAGGEAAVAPTPAVPPPCLPRDPSMVEAALAMRREHASWGAGLLAVQLAARFPDAPRPDERTVRRWLSKAGLQPAPTAPPPPKRGAREREAHGTWQMDAAEKFDLQGGRQGSWLRIVDEASGAVLGTRVFPPRNLHASAVGGRAGVG